jgi:hypothetical protein
MMRRRVLFGFFAAGAIVLSTVLACGNATGVDACQTIEHARCKWIVQCYGDAANYGLPTPRKDNGSGTNTTESPVDDCMRYYDDACLHGLVSNVQPTTDEVNTCVAAINAATDCTIVQNPETADACAFLTFDAGTDGEAGSD